jgi:hypothetical protein
MCPQQEPREYISGFINKDEWSKIARRLMILGYNLCTISVDYDIPVNY